jgi:hypothetical protein
MALVVEVVEQSSGGVEGEQRVAFSAGESEAVCFCFAVGDNARFHAEGVLAQAFALSPFGQKRPGCGAVILGGKRCGCTHTGALIIGHAGRLENISTLKLLSMVRVFRGFSGFLPFIFRLPLVFHLTIMVPTVESNS